MRPIQRNTRYRNSKPGRGGPVGNPVNRVYDSTGPDGKVRGTPQQIIDKYHQLARDASTLGDHVASESCLQHAEHYARILTSARRAAQQRRDERYNEQQPDGQPPSSTSPQPPPQQRPKDFGPPEDSPPMRRTRVARGRPAMASASPEPSRDYD